MNTQELRDIELRVMQREMTNGSSAPKSRELIDLRTLLTALDEVRADERAKVFAEVERTAHEMIGQRVGQCVDRQAPPSFPHWVDRLIERLRAEVSRG